MESHAPGAGQLVDMDVELAYWRAVYPTTEMAQGSLEFSHYEPTIKFAYDTYLLYYRDPLGQILPFLRNRYREKVSVDDQVDWRWADQIIRHAWGRMRAA